MGASPTLKMANKARAMRAEGIDVIDFSVGEPDFPTPENVKNAAKKAIERNLTKYTANEGTIDVRKAIIKRLKEDHRLEYETNEIIVSTGAKQSIYNAVLAMVEEGEEVIIPAPYWVSYPEMVALANGKSVIINTKEENSFRLTPSQLKAAITANTKLLILNNPCNPTGSGYSKSELEEIADIILEENLYVISDEIYEKLIYDDFKFVSFAGLGDEIKKRTILINGVSKAYSMTGWRIGYAAASKDIVDAMNKIQSHSTSNAASISQEAAREALDGPQYEISKMVFEFQKRRNFMHYKIESIPGISCVKPGGAFYLFPNVSSYYSKEYEGMQIRNSYGMAFYLLKHAHVAIVPGDAFGADNYIRLSYATSMENIEKGMERIIEAFSKLKITKKVKQISLSNYVSSIKKEVPVDSEINLQLRNALVAETESYLSFDNYFEWNANINGIIVQLRTNNSHLHDFWIENWYPAQLESDLEPHGIIYAVNGIPGREPRAFYNSETRTGILANTDLYSSLRSLAIGLVTDIGERLHDVHAIRGMSLDINGNGLIFIGPPGTKKTEHFFNLMNNNGSKIHTNDITFVRYSSGFPIADCFERKFYIPTNSVKSFDSLASLFDRSKCENVIIKKEDCTNFECQREDNCRLDKGSPYCYTATGKSNAMLDPYWIGGVEKHIKRTQIKWVLILRNDPMSQTIIKQETEEAIRYLESGHVPISGKEIGSSKVQPFYNPHLLIQTPERMALQRRFYEKLFNSAQCYLVNVGREKDAEVDAKIKELIGQ
jgi:aspartate/methionine/tyrosine aminotransferase